MTAYGTATATNPRDAAEWSRGRVIRSNLRAVFGRAYPRIIGLTREPSWLFFEIFLPFLAVSAFVFVYRALEAPEEYIGFVVLGGAMTAFWLNVVWMMAAQFFWEKDQGNLELYFTAPMNLMSILAGMAIGGLVMTSSRALAVIVIGSLLYGVTYDIQEPWLLVAVFFLTMIPLYGLGMLFASLFLMWGREANHLAELLQEPIYFLGGVNFPLAAIGPLAGLMMATLPLAVGLDAMRQIVFASSGVEGVLPVGHRDRHPDRDGHRVPRGCPDRTAVPGAPRPPRGPADAAVAVTHRAADVRGMTLADAWRSFRTAIGLGWAIESNWSDPFLFAVYTIAKPLAAALILVVMFQVITGGQGTEFLQFMIVGSALWNVVFGVMNGMVQSILDDRERYRMLKYIVVTPTSLFPFLIGRSLARVIVSLVAVALTLLVGVVFLDIVLQPEPVYLFAASAVGLLAVMALGISMAGWCLQLRQEAWHYPEAIAGALYLISGAIFPIDILPSVIQPVAYAMPTTWWLEASRRGLLGHGSPGAMGDLSDGSVMLYLVVSTAIALPLALALFAWFMRRARQAGLLDMTTGS